MANQQLRVVTFNYLPAAYQFVTEWIERHGHKHVLAITTPGPKSRPTPAYTEVLDLIPRHVDTLVTTRLRTVATPMIRAAKPDIILCFSFPYQITDEICSIPKYGAVNIHPSILPAFRGPNPMRQFYEGSAEFGSTAHWIAPGYDTGNLLSQASAPMPKVVSADISKQWGDLIRQCIEEGMAKAIAGDSGTIQNNDNATYAGKFTEEEKWLDFSEPSHVILRKIVGLNLTGGLARAEIDGKAYHIECAEWFDCPADAAPVGAVLATDPWGFVIKTADSGIRVQATPFCEHNKLPYPIEPKHFAFG